MPLVFSIVDKSPTSGAVDISKDTVITVTFSKDINTSTLSDFTFFASLNDFSVIPATISYDSDNYIATLTPVNDLPLGEVITVMIIGDIDDGSGFTTGVQSSEGETLAGNTEWSFTVTTSGYQTHPQDSETSSTNSDESSSLEGDNVEIVEDYQNTGDQDYNTVMIGELKPMTVEVTKPLNNSSNIDSDLEKIVIRFTDVIDPSTSATVRIGETSFGDGVFKSRDLDGIIEIEAKPMNGDPQIPSGSITGTLQIFKDEFIIYLDTIDSVGNTLYSNNEIKITILQGVKAVSGEVMDFDYSFTFTSNLHPLYVTSDAIRLTQSGPFIELVNDDVLNRLIVKNSLEVQSVANNCGLEIDWDHPEEFPDNIKKFVIYSTEKDALGASLLKNSIDDGRTKRLGDFSTSTVGGDRSMLDAVHTRIGELSRLIQIQKEILCGQRYTNESLVRSKVRWTVKSKNGVNAPTRDRLPFKYASNNRILLRDTF